MHAVHPLSEQAQASLELNAKAFKVQYIYLLGCALLFAAKVLKTLLESSGAV